MVKPIAARAFMAERSKLELGSHRDGQANARVDIDDLVMLVLSSPHLATTGEKEPDLLDSPMHDSSRSLCRSELEVCHPCTLEGQKHAYVRPVGGNVVRRHGSRFVSNFFTTEASRGQPGMGSEVELTVLPTLQLLNILPRKEKAGADDDSRECQRCVGLTEANHDQGYSQNECGYIEPPTCGHSALLGWGRSGLTPVPDGFRGRPKGVRAL